MEYEEVLSRSRAEQLPLNQLKQELESLENGSFESMRDEELRAKISQLHAGFEIQTPSYGPGSLIYRARRMHKRPRHVAEVSYPESRFVTENGRLNRAGESMFYGTLGRFNACLEECGCDIGEFFAVSGWHAKESWFSITLGTHRLFLQQKIGAIFRPLPT